MSLRRFSFLWYLGISFVVGLSIGFFQQNNTFFRREGPAAIQVRLLAPVDAIPQDFLEGFQVEFGVGIEVTTYASLADLDKYVRVGLSGFDLALIGYSQIPQLRADGKITEIHEADIRNLDKVSADFRDLPQDPGGRYSVPLYWGVRANANDRAHLAKKLHAALGASSSRLIEAQIMARDNWIENASRAPAAKSQSRGLGIEHQEPALWVEAFVLPKDSIQKVEANRVIDFFLQGDVATELASLTMNSSTNVEVEKSQLDSTLKPSHLRHQRLAAVTRNR